MLKNVFLSQLKSHFEGIKGNNPIASWQNKGWEYANDLGLPDKSHGAFQYVPLRELYSQSFHSAQKMPIRAEDFQHAIYPECRHSYLVIVDGRLSLELSDLSAQPSSVVLLTLEEAFRTFGNILNSRLQKLLSEEKDPFSALNLALHSDGVFLFVPPNIICPKPIQCLHLCTRQELPAVMVLPRLHLFIGAHSQLKWISSSLHSNTICWSNGVTDVSLEEGSHCHMVHVAHPFHSSWHFDAVRATVKKGAHLHSVSVTTGAKTVRQDYRIFLIGEGAEAKLKGIAMLKENHHAHAHILMDHQAPHTQSMQLFKGVLSDVSQSSFEGKIFVHKQAQKTQAYQLNNHLILGEGAVANSKPNLEIFADDVKASHGATVSQIDPAQLFYLKSRGIDNDLAKSLLVSAFCQEILTQIPHLSIAQQMQILLNGYLVKRGPQ